MARTLQPCFLAVALPTLAPTTVARAAQWCLRWTPRVHVEWDDPDGSHGPPLVVMDLTGCQRVNGGAARVCARVAAGLQRRAVSFHLGLAPTAGSAIARAMLGSDAATAPTAPTAPNALDALPLECLRLPESILAALLEVNLRTIGQLRVIARDALADRCGPLPAQRLDALDAAQGPRAWPLRAITPPAPIEAEFLFAGPCTQLEAVERAFEYTLRQLCAQLEHRARGARSLLVRIDRTRAAAVVGTLHFGVPTRDPKHLWSLLRPRVASVDLGDIDRGSGVERVLLRVGRTGRVSQGLGTLIEGDAHACDGATAHAVTERAVGELIDQIAARIGQRGVQRAGDAETPP